MTVLIMLYCHIKWYISVVAVKPTASSEAKPVSFLCIGTAFVYSKE